MGSVDEREIGKEGREVSGDTRTRPGDEEDVLIEEVDISSLSDEELKKVIVPPVDIKNLGDENLIRMMKQIDQVVEEFSLHPKKEKRDTVSDLFRSLPSMKNGNNKCFQYADTACAVEPVEQCSTVQECSRVPVQHCEQVPGENCNIEKRQHCGHMKVKIQVKKCKKQF